MVHRQPLLVPCRHFGRESLRVTTVRKYLVPGFRELLGQSETKTVRRSGAQNRRHGAAFLCGGTGPGARVGAGRVMI
ncbi:hypothetical protein [Streptomyces brevispora]|uniref:hypothetical protein n=1 Tax=Streptomyces brevispora TaxID=887462 RepID=UPI0035E2FCCB